MNLKKFTIFFTIKFIYIEAAPFYALNLPCFCTSTEAERNLLTPNHN
jgi:hypothetical protein